MDPEIEQLAEAFADMMIADDCSPNEMREWINRLRIDLRGDGAYIFHRILSKSADDDEG